MLADFDDIKKSNFSSVFEALKALILAHGIDELVNTWSAGKPAWMIANKQQYDKYHVCTYLFSI